MRRGQRSSRASTAGRPPPRSRDPSATILFSGTAQGAARFAQDELAEHFGVGAELWSATSYKRLREEALAVERWNRLHPAEPARTPRVTELLADASGPIVAVTDFMKAVPDQIARWVPARFLPLGTDGFGRSDTREALRRFFETDGPHVVVAVLASLAAVGDIKPEVVDDAIRRYDIDPEAARPLRVLTGRRQPNDTESSSHVPRSSVVVRSWVTPPGTRPRSATIAAVVVGADGRVVDAELRGVGLDRVRRRSRPPAARRTTLGCRTGTGRGARRASCRRPARAADRPPRGAGSTRRPAPAPPAGARPRPAWRWAVRAAIGPTSSRSTEPGGS